MHPSSTGRGFAHKKTGTEPYIQLEKKNNGVFNFSIVISVVIISLVFLILNQNVKRQNVSLESTVNKRQPVTVSVAEPVMKDASALEVITTNSIASKEHLISKPPAIANAPKGKSFGTLAKVKHPDFISTEKNRIDTIVSESITVKKSGIDNSTFDDTKKLVLQGGNKIIDNNDTTAHASTSLPEAEKSVVPETVLPENNNPDARLPDTNTATTAALSAMMTNELMTQNEEVLNGTFLISEKGEEDANTVSLIKDSSCLSINPNDTTTTALTEVESNPLQGLIPLKELKLYVGGFYSPDKLMTTLIDVNTSSNSPDENIYNTFSSGLKFGYSLNKKWSLSTAVIYSSISCSFRSNKQFEIEHKNIDLPNEPVNTSFGVMDIPVRIKAQTGTPPPEDYTANWNIEGNLELKYISVPLECQYTIGKERLTCFVSLGVAANFIVSQKTEVTELNTGVIYHPHVDGLRSNYFNVCLGAGVRYRIWQRWSLFMEPTLRQAFTAMNTNVPVKTYPSFFGVSGGVLFHF